MRQFLRYLAVALLIPGGAFAQEESGGTFLERFLENNLSGAGRDVRVTGFTGALSSTATMERLTIADDAGVWLTLEQVTLAWSRAALLRGRLSVETLSAERISLERLPAGDPEAELPTPEASGFRLPELPVSVRIGEISSPSISFGEPVFGIASEFTINGSLALEGGEGQGSIDVSRIDGPQGAFLIDAAFSNATNVLEIELSVAEAPGGIVSTLAGFPGEPSVDLAITGQGPLSDFEASLTLATGEVQRLAGTLAIGGEGLAPDAPRPFRAELAGDIASLFAPDYAEFFGNDVALNLAGTRGADGALDLDTFRLDAQAIALDGSVALAPGGQPRAFSLEGRIARQDGTPVLLPIPGEPTRVNSVTLAAGFEAASGNTWDGNFRILGLDRPGFTAEELVLDGGGTIAPDNFTVGLDFAAEALDLGDPAAGAALGERVTGRIELAGGGSGPLQIDRLDLTGESYSLESSGTLDIADRDLAAVGRARVRADDLSVFAGLAQRPLAGAAELTIAGSGAILGGTFDVQVEGRTTGLSAGIPQFDAIVPGTTELRIDAARDAEGIALRTFRLASPVARASADGLIRTAGSRLNLTAEIDDGALVLPGLDGRHSLSLAAEDDGEVWTIRSVLDGATVSGSVEGEIDDKGDAPAFDGAVTLDAASLAPFGAPAGLPGLRGALGLRFEGAVVSDLSRFDARLSATGSAIATGIAVLDPLLDGDTALNLDAVRTDGGDIELRRLEASTATVDLGAAGTLSGLVGPLIPLPPGILETDPVPAFDGRISVRATDLSPAAGIAGLPGLAGVVSANLSGRAAVDLSNLDLALSLEGGGLALGRSDLDALLGGGLAAELRAAREAGGDLRITTLAVRMATISLEADAVVSGLPGALVPPPPDIVGTAVIEGRAVLDAESLAPLGPLSGLPGLNGALRATIEGTFAADLQDFDLRLDANGANLRTGIGAADTYLAGGTVLALDAARSGDSVEIRRARFASPGLTASAEGQFGGGGGDLSAELGIDDLGRIAAGLAGPAAARVRASATGSSAPWQIDATVDGPGGAAIRAEGTVVRVFDSVDLAIRGDVPLDLANTAIRPRSVSGRATLDLRVSGPPDLSSVSGRITASGVRIVAPAEGIVLENMTATIGLAAGRAQIDVNAPVQGGGSITLAGPVALSAPFDGDLRVTFENARFRDPALFDTSVSGTVTLVGPLAGGAAIAGRIALGQTELRIPSGVTGGAAPIPDITHIAEPPPVRQTRIRAGLIDADGNPPGSGSERSGGPAYSLDLRIDATNQIFVRGRGLDAELGGTLRIGGSTDNVIPSGQFDLVRGRLDILGRRLVLDQGSITLQGNFDPYLRLSASSQADGVTVSVVIEGYLTDPDVRFESSPELPEDEIVSRLLFGRGIENISAFQAAQLAASVATLTGRGGEGILGNLRNTLGIDDFDVSTNDAGQAQLTFGTYIADNLYTDVQVSDGRTELEINLELSPSITVTGSTADDGDSSIGIRFERDF